MKTILCTLFNQTYLDRGIALYESLSKNAQNFILYVLAMDDKTFEVLSDLSFPFLIPIKYSDFENETLRLAQKDRTRGEFFFLCAPYLIKYIFNTYKEQICTYVDADMYFYSDPRVLIEEMITSGTSVQVISHRYNRFERNKSKTVGKYCVQFNTFSNTEESIGLLNKWAQYCLVYCKYSFDTGVCLDQVYLNDWCKKYSFVSEVDNLGAGVAPWNINQYRNINQQKSLSLLHKSGRSCDLVFYHFENIEMRNVGSYNINAFHYWGIDFKYFTKLYTTYLTILTEKKKFLRDKYGIEIEISKHPGLSMRKDSNRFCRLVRYLTPSGFVRMCMIDLPTKLFLQKNLISIL